MTEIIIAILAFTGIGWIIYKNLKRSKVLYAPPTSIENENALLNKEDEIDIPAEPIDERTLDFSEINRAFRIAEMHFTRSNLDEAEKFFMKVLSMHPQHTETLNRLGVIYIQRGNPRKAEMIYRKLLSLTQKEPSFYANYGRCLYNQDRKLEAIEAYENAIKLDCTKANRYVSIGQIYYELENFEKAEEYFEKALHLEPGNAEYMKLHADIAELTGNLDRAHQSLKTLADKNPYDDSLKERLKNAEVAPGTKMEAAEPIETPITLQTEEPAPDSQPRV